MKPFFLHTWSNLSLINQRDGGDVDRLIRPLPLLAVSAPRAWVAAVMSAKISARLSPHKQANPWGVQRCATPLSALYQSGGFPARINHGSISSKLEWQVDIEDVDGFDFGLLVTCAEGIAETQHPFTFIARSGYRDLLRTTRAAEEAVALLPRLVGPLRANLCHRSDEVFTAGLAAIRELSAVVGPALNPFLHHLLVQIQKKSFTSAAFASDILETFMTLEENGGAEARSLIAAKVPTYAT